MAARLYILLVVAVGAAGIVWSLQVPPSGKLAYPLLLYLSLVLFTAGTNVRIPYANVDFAIDTAFVFVIVILFGLWPAMIVDGLGKFVLSVKGGKTGRLFKTPFNIASGVLAAGAAYLAYAAMLPHRAVINSADQVLPITAMVGAYFVVNTATVAVALCLAQRERLVAFWIKNFLPTGVGFMMAGSIATLVYILDRAGGTLGFVVTFPLVALVIITQKIYLRKEEDAKAYINNLETFNTQLQSEIEERKRAQDERDHLEIQLMQAQKMEAMGRLAGGVAHDFNNLLTGIIGYSTMVRDVLPANDPARDFAQEVVKAGNRASNLTRQLLAFSRRQDIQPRVLNFNTIIADAQKMLARIIGEHVAIDFDPDEALSNVKADPGQVEQILVNLLVNARDAMPSGGTIRVRTFNADLTELYAAKNIGVRPGEYVVFEVEDSGTGMDDETKKKIFEPFFTTKGVGKGTGLGLSTVYGIVKQNNGHVEVHSQVGVGTRFRIFFPRAGGELADRLDATDTHGLAAGNETILVVEDESPLRRLECLILEKCGYTLIEASNGQEALNLFRQRKTDIDLILTDVVMPHMNGKELAARARMVRPGIPVVFMTGYTKDTMETYGITDEEFPIVAKPFTNEQLTRTVRRVLDEVLASTNVA